MAMLDESEKLRELCALGDLEALKAFVKMVREEQKELTAVINSANKVNGWTALHWAAHRGHVDVLRLLLQHGADVEAVNKEGKTPCDLNPSLFNPKQNNNEDAQTRLNNTLPFVPNYLRHPPITSDFEFVKRDVEENNERSKENLETPSAALINNTVTVRARVEGSVDFVELDLPKEVLATVNDFKKHVATYFEVDNHEEMRVRWIPNLLITRDDQLQRLGVNDQLEIIKTTHVDKVNHYYHYMTNQHYNMATVVAVLAIIVTIAYVALQPQFTSKSTVLRVRVEDSLDFYEMSVRPEQMTFQDLRSRAIHTLGLSENKALKLRLRPNTILLSNEQVERLKDGDELEVKFT